VAQSHLGADTRVRELGRQRPEKSATSRQRDQAAAAAVRSVAQAPEADGNSYNITRDKLVKIVDCPRFDPKGDIHTAT
jgi:hypothetical protein